LCLISLIISWVSQNVDDDGVTMYYILVSI